jgi:hypothetical protein
MAFIQVKPFNQSQGGTTKNFCLANVTKGFGIPNKYASAWQAWENTEQHGGDAPTGLDVPVYFSYIALIDGITKNWGHIGVRLASGQFWSDGKVYKNIADYTASHLPKYVGWGESVNEGTVIKEGGNMPGIDVLRIIASEVEGFDMTKTHTGQYDKILKDAWGSTPTDDYVRHAWGIQKTHRGHLVNQIKAKDAEIAKLKAQLAVEAKVLAPGKYLVK